MATISSLMMSFIYVGCLMGMTAESVSTKSLVWGSSHRRAQTDGLESFFCPPDTFITDISLRVGDWVYYLDSITCGYVLSITVPVGAGNAEGGIEHIYSSNSNTYFIKQSHGTDTGGHVTQLSLHRWGGMWYTNIGSNEIVQGYYSDSNQGVNNWAAAMGVKVSADAVGLTDFQFIYGILDVKCGANDPDNHACSPWEGCCSPDGLCGVTEEYCGAGCQANYGSCTPAPTPAPTPVPTPAPTPAPTPVPTQKPVTPRDLTLNFQIIGELTTTFSITEKQTLLTGTAALVNVSESKVRLSYIDVVSSSGRRLDTLVLEVTADVQQSSVATVDITAAALSASTGMNIGHITVRETTGFPTWAIVLCTLAAVSIIIGSAAFIIMHQRRAGRQIGSPLAPPVGLTSYGSSDERKRSLF